MLQRPGLRPLLLWLAVAFAGPLCGPVFGFSDTVAVELFQAHRPATRILIEGPFTVRAPAPKVVAGGLHEIRSDGGRLRIVPVSARLGQGVAARRLIITGVQGRPVALRYSPSAPKRHYPGTLELSLRPDGRLRVRNVVASKEYVCAVVGSETNPGWGSEALKAQAVLTQTRLARYKLNDPLGDTTEIEAYLGADYERPAVRKAVQSVWGQILAYGRSPIQVFYHSTCAGRTSAGDDIFGEKARGMPYLAPVACPYCRMSPFAKPTVKRIPRRPFEKVFGPGLPSIVTADGAGRALEVALGDGRRMRGYEFWIRLGQTLGWDKAPGLRMTITRAADGQVEVSSTGAGHGVGLCQWGAAEQARLGRSYREILNFYLPGTEIL